MRKARHGHLQRDVFIKRSGLDLIPAIVAKVVTSDPLDVAQSPDCPAFDGPDLCGALGRFDTMPSRPILQNCQRIVAPSRVRAQHDAEPPHTRKPHQAALSVAQCPGAKIPDIVQRPCCSSAKGSYANLGVPAPRKSPSGIGGIGCQAWLTSRKISPSSQSAYKCLGSAVI
jgi:hypothetical protein